MSSLQPRPRLLSTRGPARALLTSLALLPTFTLAQLELNEIGASREVAVIDEDGEGSDWIELRNAGLQPVTTQGWHLSDDPQDLQKWPLPPATLPGGDRILILASGKDRSASESPWHTSFKLRDEGEFLALVNPAGDTVDAFSPSFPTLTGPVSYGRDEPERTWRFCAQPTPGEPNRLPPSEPPLLRPLEEEHTPLAQTSVDWPVSVQAFPGTLPLTAVTCHYRVDYKAELAVALNDEGNPPDRMAGDSIYSGYLPSRTLFGPRWDAGEMIRWRFVATDEADRQAHWPIDPQTADEDQPRYTGTVVAAPDNPSDLPILHWFTEDPDRAILPVGARASAYFQGRFYDHLRVRRRGQFGAIQWPKPKLKFDFNPGHHFRHHPQHRLVEEFNLQSHFADPSAMRENIAFGFFNEAGTPAPLTAHWQVRLNGDYFGLFSFIEQVDTDFLRRHRLDPDGAMYKANGFPSTLALGAGPSLYQKETRKNEPYDDLVALTRGINGAGDLSREDYLMDQVNLPAMVNEMACQAILKNADRLTKNYYVYRHPVTDLWQRFPWDMDGAFNRSATLDTENYASPLYGDSEHTQAPGQPIYQNFLLDAILDSSSGREMYLRRLRTLIDTYLTEDLAYFSHVFRQTLARIQAEAQRDSALWSRGDAAAEVEAILTQQLPARRRQLLEDYGPAGSGLIPPRQSPGLTVDIGHIEARPADDPDAEYLELLNPNDEAIDLSGWTLTGAIDYQFPPGTVLPRRGTLFQPRRHHLHLVKDPDAFRERSRMPSGRQGLFILGPYQGRLAAEGETVRLLDAEGALRAQKTYEPLPDPGDLLAETLGPQPLALQAVPGESAYHLRYWQKSSAPHHIQAESSTDLLTWVPHPAAPAVIATEGPWQRMQIRAEISPSPSYRLFWRLRITARP